MKRTLGASERIYPMPCPLVVGGSGDEVDLLAIAWVGVAGANPPMLALAARGTRRTLELIHAHGGEFTVNIPSTKLAKQVDYCGMATGRTTDKIADTGLTLAPSSVVATPIIAECPYNMECRISQEIPMGAYSLVIGEVLETHADKDVIGEDGMVDVGLLDPLVYIAGTREYRGLTEPIAKAFVVKTAEDARLEK